MLVKPADLKRGDRLDTEIGTFVVSKDPWNNLDDEPSVWDRVFIDVEVPEPGKFGDAARLPEVAGAAEFQWLGLMPLRYRLAFRPDADVEVTR
jgi:hypothetical protein